MLTALVWLSLLVSVGKLIWTLFRDWRDAQPWSAHINRQTAERARLRAEGARKTREVVERCQRRLDQLNERAEARKRGEEWVSRYDYARERIVKGVSCPVEMTNRVDALTNEQFKGG